MKLLRLFFVLFITLPVAVFAQSNFKPAYILKLNGDTLRGYINYREWNITPESIEFKSSLAGRNVVKYQPFQIAGFGINDIDRYVTYTGRISADDNIFPDLPSQLDTATRLDTVFLQMRYEGKPLSLLSQRDKQKSRFFVQENNGSLAELKMHQFYIQASQTSTVNEYIDLLSRLAGKYNPTAKGLQIYLERSKFTENDLSGILKIINNDKSKRSSGTFGTTFFAGLTISRNTTQFEGPNAFTGIPSTSFVPRITGGFDFFTNKYTQRLIFRGELTLSMTKPSFELGLDKGAYIRKYQFTQITASVSPQVLYSVYNTDKIKVYLGAGIGLNASTYPDNALTIDIEPTSLVQENYYDLSNYWISFPIRAGVVVNKKVDINFLYLPSTTYSNYLYFGISNTVYGLGVNYRFGK